LFSTPTTIRDYLKNFANFFPLNEIFGLGEAYCVGEMEEVPQDLFDL